MPDFDLTVERSTYIVVTIMSIATELSIDISNISGYNSGPKTLQPLSPPIFSPIRSGNIRFNNRHRMCYDEYLSQGYPIGSGNAKGRCRNLVKDPLDRIALARTGVWSAPVTCPTTRALYFYC